MKIIITESQLYNLIPQSLKRRMKETDFEDFDRILQFRKQSGPLHLDFDTYRDSVIEVTLGDFIDEYKMDIPYGITDDDAYMYLYDKLYDIYWGLLPYFKKRYNEELSDYYTKHKK